MPPCLSLWTDCLPSSIGHPFAQVGPSAALAAYSYHLLCFVFFLTGHHCGFDLRCTSPRDLLQVECASFSRGFNTERGQNTRWGSAGRRKGRLFFSSLASVRGGLLRGEYGFFHNFEKELDWQVNRHVSGYARSWDPVRQSNSPGVESRQTRTGPMHLRSEATPHAVVVAGNSQLPV